MQNLSTRDNNILLLTELMVFIDDHLLKKFPERRKETRGRKPKLSILDLLTIFAYDGLTERHKTLKGTYNYFKREYSDCFKMPNYQNFVAQSLRVSKYLQRCVRAMCKSDETAFLDSTSMEVCKPIRVPNYKVLTKRSVGFTKNLMGWFFGFKLHVAVDEKGNILGFHISSANHHDRRHAEKLIEVGVTNKVAADQHYNGKPLVAEMKALGIQIVSYTKKKKNESDEQGESDEQDEEANDSKQDAKLLGKRSIVESTFSSLKNKYNLVTSYPKSKAGFIFHYLKTLFYYQIDKEFAEKAAIP